MKQCGECGFPVRFASLFEWRGDGTILMKQRGGALLQIALLDADELQGLFDSLSETIVFTSTPTARVTIWRSTSTTRAWRRAWRAVFWEPPSWSRASP